MKLLTQQIGTLTRRCDARCYAAKAGGECDCICGGKNHAAGIERALANVKEIFLGAKVEGAPGVTRAAERAMERHAARVGIPVRTEEDARAE